MREDRTGENEGRRRGGICLKISAGIHASKDWKSSMPMFSNRWK
jgi:hypothetical protein